MFEISSFGTVDFDQNNWCKDDLSANYEQFPKRLKEQKFRINFNIAVTYKVERLSIIKCY